MPTIGVLMGIAVCLELSQGFRVGAFKERLPILAPLRRGGQKSA